MFWPYPYLKGHGLLWKMLSKFYPWCFLFQYRKTSISWCAASKVEEDQELNKYYRTGLPTSVHCEDNGVKTMSFETQNKFACCNFDIHYFIGVLSDIEMLSVFNYFFYNIKKNHLPSNPTTETTEDSWETNIFLNIASKKHHIFILGNVKNRI